MELKTETGMQCPTYHSTGIMCAGCEKCAPVQAQPVAGDKLLQRWASWMVINRPEYFKDHACKRCTGFECEMTVDGFSCVYHEAKDVLGGCATQPAAASESDSLQAAILALEPQFVRSDWYFEYVDGFKACRSAAAALAANKPAAPAAEAASRTLDAEAVRAIRRAVRYLEENDCTGPASDLKALLDEPAAAAQPVAEPVLYVRQIDVDGTMPRGRVIAYDTPGADWDVPVYLAAPAAPTTKEG